MSTTGDGSVVCDGMYSKLIDDEAGSYANVNHRSADVGLGASPVKLTPSPRSPGPYRLATICLATLCAVLVISIIAVTAHYKNKPQDGGEATPAAFQKQTQDADVSGMTDTIRNLKEEISQLQKEKDELQAKLAATEATVVTTESTITCPTDWHYFNNSCYLISQSTEDWEESKAYCERQGAHLAIIHTAEEQTFLWDLLPRGHWNSYWFGITDEHTEDNWKWVDGTPLVGGFWEDGEPNNHIDEDCGYIVKTRKLERVATKSWYDAPCSMFLPFICEKEMSVSTTSATTH